MIRLRVHMAASADAVAGAGAGAADGDRKARTVDKVAVDKTGVAMMRRDDFG